MKRLTCRTTQLATLFAFCVVVSLTTRAQTIATWTGGGSDNNWNTAANWDLGVPAEGTNAFIGPASIVNYNAPMTATSFSVLDLSSAVLNVNAAGFNPDATGAAIAIQSTTAGNFPTNGLYIGNGGVVSITKGSLVLTNNSVVSIAAGGTLNINGTLQVGGVSGNTDLRVCVTNRGGILSALTTTLNPNNAAGAGQANLGAAIYILGGTNDLGDVTIRRAPAAGTEANDVAGKQGLVISNGLVRTTSLDVGGPNGNSWLTMLVAGGTVTNSGNFAVRTTGTASRGSRFHQFGGLFVSPGANNVHLRGQTAQNGLVTYTVIGATNIVNGFVLADATDTVGTVNMTNSGKIYIGGGGMTMEGSLTATNVMLNNGGVFGATDNWTGTAPIVLNGGIIDAADLGGTPRNISLSGVLRGAGALNKSGGGTLTLNNANIYSGNTLINAGKLVLGAAGSIASSPQILVASGATFDISAVAGFTLGSSRTLGGSGTVVGDLALAGGATINPGTTSPGTLTLSSALTQTGGAINHFDLPASPGPGNDLLIVNGALNVSGANIIEIVGGGAAGTVHTLIQYGSFNGSLANFTLSGTSGILSNNPTTRTISLIVQSSVRNPTNVVWVGNASANDWDTVNRSNWLNTGTGLVDYFVTGDSVLFNNTGAANPNVNIVGNNAPATLAVGASANYLFGGSGVISGSTGLTKTNTGTLTITNLNSYSGVTLIGGGVIEAANLANGGNPSSIGAASSDPNNLVFDGGTLRYTGADVGIERGATFSAGGGVVDIADGGATLTSGGSLVGSGGFTKAGAGTLMLPLANSYAGGTVVSNGTLRVGVPGAAGNGAITLAGGTLFLGMPTDNDLANPISVTSPSSLVMGGLNNRVNGAISGGAILNVTVNSGLVLTFNGNMTNYNGTFALGSSAGTFRLNSGGGNTTLGFPNATIDLGDVAILQGRNPGTMNIGALRGGAGTSLRGPGSTDGTLVWQIGSSTNEPSTTFDGTIADASGSRLAALSKVGNGTLRLTGNSTYTGATAVNEGALQVDGSFSTSAITVFGGLLTGNGTLGGIVDIQPNGILSPGASIGVMTINNLLTLQPGSTNVMELNKAAGTNDSIFGLTSVIYGGTLEVTNLAGTLANGDVFKLFDAVPGTYSGAFDAIILPAVAAPLIWDTTGLTVDGTIKVVFPLDTRPSFSSARIEGADFVLRGTNNGNSSAFYYVLTSTNVAAPLSSWTGIATNQFELDGTFAFTNVFSFGVPQRYYLLKTP